MTLANKNSGEKARVLALPQGQSAQGRLLALGILPGVEIEVLQNNPGRQSPMVIAVKETRLSLGHGLASRIVVA